MTYHEKMAIVETLKALSGAKNTLQAILDKEESEAKIKKRLLRITPKP